LFAVVSQWKKQDKKNGMKMILGVIIGGAIGFGIGYFGKCSSGTCPLISNPIISTIVGAAIGLMITMK